MFKRVLFIATLATFLFFYFSGLDGSRPAELAQAGANLPVSKPATAATEANRPSARPVLSSDAPADARKKYQEYDETQEAGGGLTLIRQGDAFGFLGPHGEVVVRPIFEEAFGFTENLAVVRQDGKYGYINTSGEPLIAPQFDYAWPVDHGVGLVRNGDLYGFVNGNGEIIAPPVFETTWGFKQGLAAVQIEGKFGFIDLHGTFVVRADYDYAWPFEADGKALVKAGNEVFKIDRTGNRVAD